MLGKHKRLQALERSARATRGAGQQIIAVVDVRGLDTEEADARIAAKHAELDACDPQATLIILRQEEGR